MPSHRQEVRKLQVNGVDIQFRIGGSGPHLLALHGFSLSGTQWTPLLDDLMDDYTLVVPDLPGHGDSAPLPGAFSFERTAEILSALINGLGIEQFIGIGHSAGAITLLHMAKQQPARLKAMILIAGAHRFSDDGLALLREDRFELLDADSQAYYRSIHPGGDAQIELIFEQMRGLADTYPESTAPLSDIATTEIPALLVFGDRDAYFPIDIAIEFYLSLPDARLWVVPNQGHRPVFSNLGGSCTAAKAFPSAARRFFAQTLAGVE